MVVEEGAWLVGKGGVAGRVRCMAGRARCVGGRGRGVCLVGEGLWRKRKGLQWVVVLWETGARITRTGGVDHRK